MNRIIEFQVSGIVEGVSGVLHVIGRNCEGAVRVGDSFQSIYRYANGEHADERVDAAPAELRVARISAYDRDLPELGPGMTGTLHLDGVGAKLVSPGCMLGAEVEPGNDSEAPTAAARPVTG